MKKRQKRLIVSIILIVIVLLAAALYYQISHPLRVKKFYAMEEPIGQESLDGMIEEYSEPGNEGGLQFFSDSDRFPSPNAGDYCEITLYADIVNIGPASTYIADYYLGGTLEKARLCCAVSAEATVGCERYATNSGIYCMTISIYRNGCTDEELMEDLQNLSLEVYYSNRFTNGIYRCQVSEKELEIVDKRPEY